MTQEEKAKRYDEIREKARKEYSIHEANNAIGIMDALERVFPELKESEDEKTRKEIVEVFKSLGDGKIPATINYANIFTYLEKQGEHAKFRDSIQVGDKVTRNQDCVLVNLSQLNRVAKKDEKQGEQKYTQRDIDNAYLKGIADVKREVEKIDEQTEKMKKEIAEFIFNSKEDIKQRYEWIKCLGFDVKFSNEEKQAEQKPTDKVEPKFKTGDRVVGVVSGMPYFITKVCDDHYNTESGCIIMFCAQDNFELYEQKSVNRLKTTAGNSFRPFEKGHKVL